MKKQPKKPTSSPLHSDPVYMEFLKDTKLQAQHVDTTFSKKMPVEFYWKLGKDLLEKQNSYPQESFMKQFLIDMKHSLPFKAAISKKDLEYICKFSDTYPALDFSAQAYPQLPWVDIYVLILKTKIPFWRLGSFDPVEIAKAEAGINTINNIYFKGRINLVEIIKRLPTAVTLEQQSDYPRLAIRKNEIEKIVNAAEELCLVLRNTSLQTKLDIQQAPEQYAQKGYFNLADQNNNWTFSQFENSLGILHENGLFALPLIPADPGGPSPYSIPRFVISQLIPIYEVGAKKQAKCGAGEEKGVYHGEFYTFLIDIQPLLMPFGISLGTPSTIGSYATETISKYRAALLDYQASLLDEHLALQELPELDD